MRPKNAERIGMSAGQKCGDFINRNAEDFEVTHEAGRSLVRSLRMETADAREPGLAEQAARSTRRTL